MEVNYGEISNVYTTLTDCYFGLRCLTWQNICDGKYIIHCLFLTIK